MLSTFVLWQIPVTPHAYVIACDFLYSVYVFLIRKYIKCKQITVKLCLNKLWSKSHLKQRVYVSPANTSLNRMAASIADFLMHFSQMKHFVFLVISQKTSNNLHLLYVSEKVLAFILNYLECTDCPSWLL